MPTHCMSVFPSRRKFSLPLGALLVATFASVADWTVGGRPDLRWSIAGNWQASFPDENLVFGSALLLVGVGAAILFSRSPLGGINF